MLREAVENPAQLLDELYLCRTYVGPVGRRLEPVLR